MIQTPRIFDQESVDWLCIFMFGIISIILSVKQDLAISDLIWPIAIFTYVFLDRREWDLSTKFNTRAIDHVIFHHTHSLRVGLLALQ